MNAPTPANENQRLAALLSCGVLDSPAEPAFDDIAQLAAQLCHAPIALVSLVDRSRQWFKARVGLSMAAQETSRDVSFCAHAILSHDPLIVTNALNDPRFSDNPLVLGSPFIRFYAGMPLVLEDGFAVGTLCILDTAVRELTTEQLDGLRRLARHASHELDLRRQLAAARQQGAETLSPEAAKSADFTPLSAGGALRSSLPVAMGSMLEDRFRLDYVLARGGMGLLLSALDVQTGKRAAIKFMLKEHTTRDGVERFVREAQALVRMEGAHVARVLSVGNLPGGEPYIVMDQLEGEDLATRLRARGALPWKESVSILLGACAAVQLAHERGILHRDLKPANIFLARSPQGPEVVKVLDFGISKLWSIESGTIQTGLTRANAMLGTPQYMSPEQMSCEVQVDERADVWSLGVILYEMIAGQKPFDGDSIGQICSRVLSSPAPSITRQEIPRALRTTIDSCLQKDVARRTRSVVQLAASLRTLV